MSFFDALESLRRNWQADLEAARRSIQAEALRESNPSDLFVTMRIMGDSELKEMTRAGWQLVSQDASHKHPFSDEYLMRMTRAELTRQLSRDV